MKRRQFVTTALLAGSAAGCTGLQTNDSPTESSDTADTPNGDSTNTMTDEHETGVQRQIELTNVEIPPEDVPVSIGMNIQESKVTADQAARIEVGTSSLRLFNSGAARRCRLVKPWVTTRRRASFCCQCRKPASSSA